MAKLTDTQLVILSAAARRDAGAVLPLPASLKVKGAAATRTLESLRRKGLLEEQPAAPEAESWREAEDGQRVALVITDKGLGAINVKRSSNSDARKTPAKKRSAGANGKSKQLATAARAGTKQAIMIDLLNRKTGATIEEIVAVTGWQPHSVRGAISGTLKKKLGLTVASEKVDVRGRVYRIVAEA